MIVGPNVRRLVDVGGRMRDGIHAVVGEALQYLVHAALIVRLLLKVPQQIGCIRQTGENKISF